MVYEKPPYVDWPGDIFVVVAWTAAWGLAHSLLHRGFLVPLASRWFKTKADADIVPRSATGKKAESSTPTSSAINSKAAKATDDAKAVMRIRQKFIYSGWKCFVYSLSTAVGIFVLSEDTWWLYPKEWWLDFPNRTSWLMKTYYYIGFGSYVYQTLTVMSASKQSDFWGVVVHHIATISVMAASYAFGFTRIGVVILLLHDCSDPFMEYAKCNLYMGKQKLADLFFILFALVFLATRNVLFPYVIYCAHQYSILEDGTRMPRGHGEWGNFCLGCLWVLAALNMYWGYLILKIAVLTAAKGEVEGDIRDEE
ncbi:hypothetical protein HDU83_002597 [Entophlyctis luteolus]|nr:hypothetical protein HDU82_006969 [Entophlyctis luteolus]KAJ3346872.1 hypothetical protein HDU83_002597 [Entophlyctis luteolus]KAJ3385922.1 hypothetical protein HDU84_001898 [Entophlyctis sp. JEL0112]